MRIIDYNGFTPDVDSLGREVAVLAAEAGEIVEALKAHRQQGIALTESLARVRRQIDAHISRVDVLLAGWGSDPAA